MVHRWLAVVCAMTVAGCAGYTEITQPSAVARAGDATIAAPLAEASQHVGSASPTLESQSFLAGLRQATAIFHDTDRAREAGYAPADGHCEQTASGAMGIH